MREQVIKAILAHANGEIAKHKANVEVYKTNAAGIGEHPGIVEAIESEVAKIAEANDKIETIRKYF